MIIEECKVLQPPHVTLMVLTYEVGHLHENFIKKLRYPQYARQYDEQTRQELSDVFTMAGLLAEQLGYKIEDLQKEGIQRLRDRMVSLLAQKSESLQDRLLRTLGD